MRTRRKIGAYLDGALEGGSARAAAAHIAQCPNCQHEADDLRRLRGALRTNLAIAEPDWTGFWPGVVRGIEDAKRVVPARSPGRWRPRWAVGGALATALLLVVTFWQLRPGPVSPEGGVVVSSANTDDPRGTVMVYSTPEQDVAVVWVFGLE